MGYCSLPEFNNACVAPWPGRYQGVYLKILQHINTEVNLYLVCIWTPGYILIAQKTIIHRSTCLARPSLAKHLLFNICSYIQKTTWLTRTHMPYTGLPACHTEEHTLTCMYAITCNLTAGVIGQRHKFLTGAMCHLLTCFSIANTGTSEEQ